MPTARSTNWQLGGHLTVQRSEFECCLSISRFFCSVYVRQKLLSGRRAKTKKEIQKFLRCKKKRLLDKDLAQLPFLIIAWWTAMIMPSPSPRRRPSFAPRHDVTTERRLQVQR